MYASKDLQANGEIVLAAVKRHGESLEFASNGLKGNQEVVLEAVKQNGLALRYASAALLERRVGRKVAMF